MRLKSGGEASVAFIVPTLNAERCLERLLSSIASQTYPREKSKVLVVDGGSTDSTKEICDRYSCQVIQNPRRLAEPGVGLGLRLSAADVNFVVAADNELPRTDWIHLMLKPLNECEDVFGVFTRILNSPTDPIVARYINLLHADPYSWYVFHSQTNPRSFRAHYDVVKEHADYTVFDFSLLDFPLLALAQGFGVRKGMIRNDRYEYDDVLPILQMLTEGKRMAYVPKAGIYHHNLSGIADFISKYRSRTRIAMTSASGYRQREQYFSMRRKIRQRLWLPYSISMALPFLDSVKGMLEDRDIAWLVHPVTCLSMSMLIAISLIEGSR
jgi:glycosyltransferase involved in cell wall biosynthesis